MYNLSKNKRGIAAPTMGELILEIAMGIVIAWVVLAIVAVLSPTASSAGCGLNVRVRSATLDASAGWLGSPILMCGQYNTPVNINAADFKACPGISEFCKTTKNNTIKVECWKQCARIQVDKLTDSCWTMAGSGKLDLKDSMLSGLTQTFTDPWKMAGIITYSAGIGALAHLAGLPAAPFAALASGTMTFALSVDNNAKILKCYRYRIVNPIVFNKVPINYEDSFLGRSWAYGLECSCSNCTTCKSLMDPKVCKPTTDNPMCSFGGEGVKYVNELGEPVYKINGVGISIASLDTAAAGGFMNYNITDPKNQVCYIAYYQGKDSGNKYVIRSCYAWNAYTGGASYVN